MPHDLMTKCEKKTLFKQGNEKVWKWKEVPVSSLTSGSSGDIRCMHCHGSIRVHKQKVDFGPVDHVEHRSHIDSENCKGGIYFKGIHKVSLDPVE